jgi:hypothetical protein
LNRPRDSDLATEKVLDSPVESRDSGDASEDEGGPKEAENDPVNLEKPDRVGRSKGNRGTDKSEVKSRNPSI